MQTSHRRNRRRQGQPGRVSLAKTEFGVPRVVARVNHPQNEWLFNESWGVDVSVSTPRIMSALVEEAVSVGDLVRLFTFRQGEANLVELTPPDDFIVGTAIADVVRPTDTTLVSVIRGSTSTCRCRTCRWRPTTSSCSSPHPTANSNSRTCCPPTAHRVADGLRDARRRRPHLPPPGRQSSTPVLVLWRVGHVLLGLEVGYTPATSRGDRHGQGPTYRRGVDGSSGAGALVGGGVTQRAGRPAG